MNWGLIGGGLAGGIVISAILFLSGITKLLFILLLLAFIAIFIIGTFIDAVDPNLAWSISVVFLIAIIMRFRSPY